MKFFYHLIIYSRGLKLKQAGGPHWTKFKSPRAALYCKTAARATNSKNFEKIFFNQSKMSVNWRKIVKTSYFHTNKIEKMTFSLNFYIFLIL